MERISPQLFYQYLTCPQWIWFDRFGDLSKKKPIGEMQQKLIEQGVSHETQFMHQFFSEHQVTKITARDWDTAVSETTKAMKAGAEAIYQGRLQTTHYQGIPDLLMRREGKSKFGEWLYEPIDIKSSFDLKDEHKYQLTLYSLVLADMQGVEPPHAGIITAAGELAEFSVENFKEKFFDLLEKIERVISGEKPPLQLTIACKNSPWYDCCVAEAEATDDIALLYKVDKRALEALREFGVRTVEDARRIDPTAFGDRIPYLKQNGLERMKQQAESLKTGKILKRRDVTLPAAPYEIFFDIEGDPLCGVDYLFGVLISDRNSNLEEYRSFVAEQPGDEQQMWRQFVDWTTTLPSEYVVFHYEPYEQTRLQQFSKKYGAEMSDAERASVAKFQSRLFDLNDCAKENFIFPLYFYGLKQICKYLGFAWRNSKGSGVQSIFWFEEWLKTGDRALLNEVIGYNEDDVRATKFFRDWITTFSGHM